MSIVAEQVVSAFGRNYKITRVGYSSSAGASFLVDQSATSVAVLEPASGAPSATLGSGDSNFEKTVTLAAGGVNGEVTVITAHSGSPAAGISSSKPDSRS